MPYTSEIDGDLYLISSVTFHRGQPVIEVRVRALSGGGTIPEGKVVVSRMPILPPGAEAEDYRAATETEIIEDGGLCFAGLRAGDGAERQKRLRGVKCRAWSSSRSRPFFHAGKRLVPAPRPRPRGPEHQAPAPIRT